MANPPDREFAVFQRGEIRDLALSLFRNALRSQVNPDTGITFTEDSPRRRSRSPPRPARRNGSRPTRTTSSG